MKILLKEDRDERVYYPILDKIKEISTIGTVKREDMSTSIIGDGIFKNLTKQEFNTMVEYFNNDMVLDLYWQTDTYMIKNEYTKNYQRFNSGLFSSIDTKVIKMETLVHELEVNDGQVAYKYGETVFANDITYHICEYIQRDEDGNYYYKVKRVGGVIYTEDELKYIESETNKFKESQTKAIDDAIKQRAEFIDSVEDFKNKRLNQYQPKKKLFGLF